MVSARSFFDSFKEFIWDIIGYLLPGSYVLILLSICVNQEYFVSPSLGAGTNGFLLYIFIVVAYLLGYVAYGFGLFKEELMGNYSYKKKLKRTLLLKRYLNFQKN